VAGRPVPFVGDAVPFISNAVAVVSGPLALISGPLALVSGMVALVSEPLALLSSDVRLVECRPALGQVGLGGLEGLLGGLGAGLGLPDPGVVQGQGGQPLALGVLDDLLGEGGQLARGRPGPPPQLPERLVRAEALGGGQDPFGLLDSDPAGQRLAQLDHLQLPGG
jgi:hypothetical protein